MNALNQLSATEAARLIGGGEITSLELVDACLAHIGAREPAVEAWAHLDPAHARRQARALDAVPRGARGGRRLHGVPLGVKDIIDTVDMPTAYGSAIYHGHRPAWDAACVALVRAAGAVILGKTVTSEFATYHLGRTKNPHDPARTPGISSMGSAAAVADFMAPLAFGTQTGASIIRPASFCGSIGYKPSFGAFSRAGVRPVADSLDTLGFFARTIDDVALLGAVLSCRPEFGSGAAETPRIGLCRTAAWPKADRAVRDAMERARASLAAAGAAPVEVELPAPFAGLNEATLTILRFEGARAFSHEYHAHRERLSAAMRRLIEDGLACPAARYEEARALAVRCRELLGGVFASAEVLVTPAAECEPPLHANAVGDSVFNRLWTLLHVPCLSVPIYKTAAGLPVGVQLVGPMGGDDALIRAARWIMARVA